MENTAAIRQVQHLSRPSAGCRRSTAQPAKKRTRRFDGHGFLKHSFKPLYGFNGNHRQAETDFYRSAENLYRYYDLPLPFKSALPFPENVSETFAIISKSLSAKTSLSCEIVQDGSHPATLATFNYYGIGMHLYYIPVRGFCKMAQSAQEQERANLIQAIFAYLYQIVKIPFYTDYGSYVGSQYDMLEEWITQEEDGEMEQEYLDEQLAEIEELRAQGAIIQGMIAKPEHLRGLTQILAMPVECQELSGIACAFLQLYIDYPGRSVFDNINGDLYPADEERIHAEQYISFFWSGNDCLVDMLDDTINCSFQEIGIMEEPVAVQLFDSIPQTLPETFDFERRLFDLIDTLCEYLNKYD